uniref:Ovule protein n=1 Tax=Caenorhabditis tropicalis TaxID=1561998 RepID=A0A1I7TMA9_9PELO
MDSDCDPRVFSYLSVALNKVKTAETCQPTCHFLLILSFILHFLPILACRTSRGFVSRKIMNNANIGQ